MKFFDPHLLQKWTGGVWNHAPTAKIENFCFDTRKLKKNECFLAIKNTNNDGHNYVQTAENLGAVAAIVEHEIAHISLPQLVVKNTLEAFQKIAKHYRETLPTKIIGITGSCGKTTLKELLALLLGDKTFKTPENFNNHLGLPFSITQIDPEIHENAVIEVGISQPNEMDALADMLQPDEAVLTNIGPAHLGNFGSLEAIGIEKFKLLDIAKSNVFFFEEFLRYNHKKDACCILSELSSKYSKDKNESLAKATHWKNFHIINCAFHKPECGWDIEIDGVKFNIPFKLGNGAIRTFALAIVVALKHNVAPNLLQKRLQRWQPFQNRGIWKTINGTHYFIDCYNANPASYADSLQHFYNEKPANTPACFILGSMEELGSNSEVYHKGIAQHIPFNPKDHFICIGHFCETIKDGLKQRGFLENQIQCAKTTAEATPLLANLPQKYIYLKGSHCYHLENLVAEK